MESERETTEEIEKFAERILAEPEYRKIVLAVLYSSRKKFRPLIADETLLQKLIGPPFQAKTIVTLFRTIQGAEYPEFCRDLFEAAKILTALGAIEEGMTLFIAFGLVCFGGAGLSNKERKEVLGFLQAERKVVNMPAAMQQVLDDYSNQTLEPKIEIYRQLRKDIMEKIRNPDEWQHRFAKNVARSLFAFMIMYLGASILRVAFPETPDKDPDGTDDVSPAPKESDEIHPVIPSSHARSICGSSGERTTFGFLESNRTVRVTCGMEENEPFLEIAERSLEGTINCVDLGLDDIPDACGLRETEEEELTMVSPPRENLDRWFKETLKEAAGKINH